MEFSSEQLTQLASLLDNRINPIKNELALILNKVEKIEKDISTVQSDVSKIQVDMNTIQKDIEDIKVWTQLDLKNFNPIPQKH